MATTYTKETKPTTTYTKESDQDFLLKEDAFYLLLEDGGKIVIRRGFVLTEYTKETKP
jgi:hypothetical protein